MDGVRGVGSLSPLPQLPQTVFPPPPPGYSAPPRLRLEFSGGKLEQHQANRLPGRAPLLLGGPGREKLLPITRGAERGAFPCAGTGRALCLPCPSLPRDAISVTAPPSPASPGLCPLPPSQAGRVTPCVPSGLWLWASKGAVGLSLARTSLSANPDPAVAGPGGALAVSFSLRLVSVGRNPTLQRLAAALLCLSRRWIDRRRWRSRCQAASGARRCPLLAGCSHVWPPRLPEEVGCLQSGSVCGRADRGAVTHTAARSPRHPSPRRGQRSRRASCELVGLLRHGWGHYMATMSPQHTRTLCFTDLVLFWGE